MKRRALVIPLQQADAGMRVASDVCHAAGGSLVTAGTELTAALIDALRRRGIEIIAVDVEDDRSAERIAAEKAQAQDRIAQLFRRHCTDPGMRELMDAVLDYRLQALE